ncbi:hypothetical protein GCM10023144_04790 [Pigmentiphaga soli]|uniref:GTPase n=1 Tax=Pigmentiphaga soli TaxID=1007095 RepID=A0ABP8GG24_9BURK
MATALTLLAGAELARGRSLALEAAQADTGPGPRAVIIEGGPGTFQAPPGVELVQLAAGCACCVGQLPLRVTVARLLRLSRPARMWIEVASAQHLPELRRQLSGPAFGGHLALEPDAGGDPSAP